MYLFHSYHNIMNVEQWSADNFMQVNASKTKEMVIGKRTITEAFFIYSQLSTIAQNRRV